MAKGASANHTSARRGTWVSVKLQDGTIFTDQFVERKGKYLIFKENGRFLKADVVRFAVVRKDARRI